MLRRGAASPATLNKGSSRDPKSADRRVLSGVATLLDLQRSHGNAFVQRLVQHKMAIRTPVDRDEKEADRVAGGVVRNQGAGSSMQAISRQAELGVRRMCTECDDEMQRGSPSISGVIARQPKPPSSPDPGWSDAPQKGLNQWVTTVDEKGNIVPGKGTNKGVWRVPVEGLTHGLQKGDKGPAFESPGGRAVALIPNTITPTASDKDNVPIDVLFHLHGHGVGYRELEPGKSDRPGVLKPGQLRDVELYQMEQQLLSHVAVSKRLIIAVLPQGSERSDFGDLTSNSDAYLNEVFAKLVPKYLPKGAVPGRVTVSGHSGGGPTAMAIAAKARTRTDVFLFDAINSGCIEKEEVKDEQGNVVTDKKGNPKMQCKKGSPCASNEYSTVSQWVTSKMEADVKNVSGKTDDQKKSELQTNGTRFRGYTSESLATKNTCSYGFWYNKLKTDIETKIIKLKVSPTVADQLRENYQVRQVQGPHERVMGKGN